jgi:hypothetical protein
VVRRRGDERCFSDRMVGNRDNEKALASSYVFAKNNFIRSGKKTSVI